MTTALLGSSIGGSKLEFTAASRMADPSAKSVVFTSMVIFTTEHPRTRDWLLVSTSLRRQAPFTALSKVESRRMTAPGFDLPMISAVAECAATLVGDAKENVD
jgi:hypothetical protein